MRELQLGVYINGYGELFVFDLIALETPSKKYYFDEMDYGLMQGVFELLKNCEYLGPL